MSNPFKGARGFVVTTASSFTAIAVGLTLSVAPVLAATPGDYGLHEGDTISASGSSDPDIYIVNDWGYKRVFVNPAIFGFYAHLGGFANVHNVTAAVRDAFPTSALFRNCESNDQAVWALEVNGEDTAVLHHVAMSGADAVAQDANFFKKVFCINNNEAAWYPKSTMDYTMLSQIPVYVRGAGPTPSTGPVAGFNPNGGTQGSIDEFSLGSPAKSEALEGQSNVEIYAVDANLSNDGPLMVQTADVWFAETTGAASVKPWDYFKKVSLMVNGVVVASMNADNSADWSENNPAIHVDAADSRDYRMRFTGLSGVLKSDDTTTVSVAVTMNSVIDSADQDAVWAVELGNLRIMDESGLVQTIDPGDGSYTADSNDLEDTFTLGATDAAIFKVRDATDKVDAKVIEVSDSSDTNGVPLYSFTIEETNGVAMDITEMTLNFDTSDAYTDVYRKGYLYEGATLRGSETVSSGATVFDNMAIHLNGNQKKTFTVKADFKDTNDQANYQDGDTVAVGVQDDSVVFTDANGNDEADYGSQDVTTNPDTHELRVHGIRLDLVSVSSSHTTATPPADDVGTYVIKYKVTAFGADQYVSDNCAIGDDTSYSLFGVTSGADSCTLQSTGTTDSGTFLISDGSSETITATVAVSQGTASGFTGVQLEAVGYDEVAGSGDDNSYNFNLDDFKTGSEYLVKN